MLFTVMAISLVSAPRRALVYCKWGNDNDRHMVALADGRIYNPGRRVPYTRGFIPSDLIPLEWAEVTGPGYLPRLVWNEYEDVGYTEEM